MTDRRGFLKSMAAAASTAAVASVLPTACGSADDRVIDGGLASGSGLIVPKGQGLRITGTFLDEISHDIPHQNWGEKEWDMDFRYMNRYRYGNLHPLRLSEIHYISVSVSFEKGLLYAVGGPY